MLKKRLITVLTFNDGVLFRTKNFSPDYRYTHKFVDTWSIDEVMILDITRTKSDRTRFYQAIKFIASQCFVPISVGGKVTEIEEIRKLLRVGADKVVINSASFHNPNFIQLASKEFGAQCIVCSIDAKRDSDGNYEVLVDNGSLPTGMQAVEWARKLERLGAGEICICSIERDGSLEGYDNTLNRLISEAVSVPVLVVGGAGKWQDFADGFSLGGADAACTTNIYHFTESSIKSAKNFLLEKGFQMRV